MRAEQGVTFVDLDAIAEKIDEKEEDDVENFVEALGISYATTEELRVGEKERERDVHRWELNPACAEDYISRTHTRN